MSEQGEQDAAEGDLLEEHGAERDLPRDLVEEAGCARVLSYPPIVEQATRLGRGYERDA